MKATLAWRCRACGDFGERLLNNTKLLFPLRSPKLLGLRGCYRVVSRAIVYKELGRVFLKNLDYNASTRTPRLLVAIGYIWKEKIIMVNIIPPDHVDDLPVVEPNQPDVVLVIPEHVLVDEDEDPEEEEFKEEEETQEEKDMDINDEEDENEPELTFPYEEANPLNPPPPASDSEPEDVIEVDDTVESEDETVPASVHVVGESSTALSFRRKMM
ncbi:hypothetical protein Tco_1367106, partial [Tanacetum coccineum]